MGFLDYLKQHAQPVHPVAIIHSGGVDASQGLSTAAAYAAGKAKSYDRVSRFTNQLDAIRMANSEAGAAHEYELDTSMYYTGTPKISYNGSSLANNIQLSHDVEGALREYASNHHTVTTTRIGGKKRQIKKIAVSSVAGLEPGGTLFTYHNLP